MSHLHHPAPSNSPKLHEAPQHTTMQDSFGRSIDYLRISVTDRCNEKCLYCMPEGYKGWAQRSDHMTADEIIQITDTATRLGFRKFRLTGGEPLVRKDIVDIARRIWELPGVETLGLSTNATRLAELALPLKQAGVRSLNISLDALDPTLYQRITGGQLQTVLAGIEAAQHVGFEVIKLNCVLMHGVNETEFLPLARFAADRAMPLRFIELMPLTRTDVLDTSNFLPVREVMRYFGLDTGDLLPLDKKNYHPGHGPAKYYTYRPFNSKLGFIGALTNPHFCESCNKLRLTADGKLRPCLGRHGEVALLDALRHATATPEDMLRKAIANKPENHEFSDCYEPGRPMTAIGG